MLDFSTGLYFPPLFWFQFRHLRPFKMENAFWKAQRLRLAFCHQAMHSDLFIFLNFAPSYICFIFIVFAGIITEWKGLRNPPTVVPVCVALHRSQAKLISYTGCPPRPTLSGVISLYFMVVDLRPSSLSPSVALTHSTLPPICSKLTTSIIPVTIFGIVEVLAVLPCRECPPGWAWASLWYVRNLFAAWLR